MDFFSVSCLFTAIISLFGGIFIYFKDRKAPLNQVWAKMSLAVFFWSLSLFFVVTSTKENIALFWQYLLDISAIFIPILFFHFTLVFLSLIQERRFKIQLWIIYSLGLTLALFSLTPFFKIGVAPVLGFNFWVIPGSLYILFPLFFLSVVLYSFYLFIKNYLRAPKITKLQTKYILLAGFIGFGGGITNFLPQFIKVLPIGNYLISLYIVIIILAITKYHLFEIRVILTETLVAAIGLTLLIQVLIAETLGWKIFGSVLLVAFAIMGYLLIRYTYLEIKRREEIERIDRAKSEFISIASHQLRTPLTAVKGYISMVIEGTYGQLTEKQSKPLENVYQSNERLIKLVNDLLNLSRLDAGKIEFNPELTSLEEMVSGIVEELKINAEKKGLYMKIVKPLESLPKIMLDQDKLRQVILNIVDNAIKYTKEGGVTFELKKLGRQAEIRISDTGEGMDEKELASLFQMFSRATAGTQLHAEGAGIGLYVARQFVEMHGGKIWVESEGKGRGSTFYIQLPTHLDAKLLKNKTKEIKKQGSDIF